MCTTISKCLSPALLLPLLVAPAAARAAEEPGPRVRGFCIAAPGPSRMDEFVKFIDEELTTRGVNTLVLRVDYNYRFTSRPELADADGLSRGDVAKIVAICRRGKIRVIPQINLLGHQSWANHPGRLLRVHPELDETPWVKMPEHYKWPNEDRLYCKSYCPRHPQVHEVVFPLVDEICDAFEADAFHAGLDEVFYIGESKCPRCGGADAGELFASEVRAIRDHLAAKGRKLWIWGDRLLDGEATGLGEWEASTNRTARAIDLIPKDIVVCDWHYERAVPTPAYFALKGLDVVACPWRKGDVAVRQLRDMRELAAQSPAKTGRHFAGVIQTVWSGCDGFLDEFYGRKPPRKDGAQRRDGSEVQCFKMLAEAWGAGAKP
ncbi:Glycosyl hydrolase family 20, catalytic domain [Aquisphaera giovannonii]|uniref:Glycosyl hydrolase family 20, catalytic domain n=1 Tax=Aquisphaera giovannonii TaxID=406548 RepID=A0A5B9VZW9_9BACT|nr:family 20 glycosylhydrolase [Aquisphaera giovannonii]QEH33803.1 Glycosyl hydrolase family 20, catalytic domain [Aquisphaera giovannonii]